MTDTATCAADAVAAIVTAMRARTGYRSPWSAGSDGDVPVCHSAEAGAFGEGGIAAARLLVIADTGDPDAPQEASDGTQRPAVLGTTRGREETVKIRCRAIAQTGDPAAEGVVEAQWAAALAMVSDVQEELAGAAPRIGPSLGLSTATYRNVTARLDQVTSISAYQSRGTVVEVLFELEVKARL